MAIYLRQVGESGKQGEPFRRVCLASQRQTSLQSRPIVLGLETAPSTPLKLIDETLPPMSSRRD